jgi:lysophospholipase L1-like esterase
MLPASNPSASPLPAEARGKRPLLRRLAFSLAILLLVPAAIEIALRVAWPSLGSSLGDRVYEPDDELGFRGRPHATGTFANGVSFGLNALGFRGREVAVPKPAGTWRLLVLGDSFAFGKGVADGEPFPEVLESRLRERLPGQALDVVDGGMNGYGTDQQAALLRRVGRRLEPDAVVLAFFVGNDFGDNMAAGELTAYDGYLFRSGSVRMRGSILGRLYLGAKIGLRRLYLVNAIESLGPALRPIERGSPYCRALVEREANALCFFRRAGAPRAMGDDVVAVTRRLVGDVAAQSRAIGAKLAIVALPDPMQIEPELLRTALRQTGESEDALDLSRPQSILASMAAETGAAFVDARAAFPERETGRYLLPCDTHFDRRGHAAVAAFLADELARQGLLR